MITKRLQHSLFAGIAAAGILLSPLCVAATPAASANESKTVIEQAKAPVLTGDLGVNFVSQYIARGVVLENQGVIIQPYADVYYPVYEAEGFVNKVFVNMGLWGSIHSEKTFAPKGSDVPAWFEQDYTPGLTVNFAQRFSLTSRFCWYTSPSGAFPGPRALNTRLDFNDADLLGAFALHPHFTYLRELKNKVATGPDQGNYFEFGIAPSLPAMGLVLVTLPLSVGFGSDQFYANNEGFGYFSGGVNLAVPVKCIPAGYGSWTFNTGVTYTYINEKIAPPNAVRGMDHNPFVFSGGIGALF